MRLKDRILDLLGHIEISPRRILLDTGSVRASVPMLRGVWGRALLHLDKDAYAKVFEGRKATSRYGVERTPLYIIRPSPADPDFAPAMDWILIGQARRFEDTLLRAWDVATGMGLGVDRIPFSLRQTCWLNCCSVMTSEKQSWSLHEAARAMRSERPDQNPVELRFNTPLRLLRRGKLITNPTFPDLAVALTRRLLVLVDEERRMDHHGLTKEVSAAAAQISAASWHGQRSDFVRWSGTQHRELDMRGITGSLQLPQGAGDLWPLLAAGIWLHAGKGSIFGLGQLQLVFPGAEYSKTKGGTVLSPLVAVNTLSPTSS